MTFIPDMPLNYSRIKHLDQSPLHFRAACERQFKETDAMRTGSATHCLIYEPHQFPYRFIEWTGGRRYGREWDAFIAENEGKTILTPQMLDHANAIADAVRAHPVVRDLLADGNPVIEQRLYWTDGGTGLELAGTPDFVGCDSGTLLDLKTTANAIPRQFAAYAARMNYAAQVAMYRDGLNVLWRHEIRDVYWIVVESKPPHDVIPYRVPEHVLDEGVRKYRGWLDLLLKCMADQEWPGMGPGVTEFVLPEWAYGDDEDVELVLPGGERLTV